jgi:hypothetical protein
LQPRAAIPAVSSIPAFLAIFQTPAALTPPISLATAVALEGAFREAAKQYAGDHGERSVHLDGPARIGEGRRRPRPCLAASFHQRAVSAALPQVIAVMQND